MALKYLVFALTLVFLVGCMDQSYEEIKAQRNKIASNSKEGDPIIVGISWRSAGSDLFIDGVKLAVKEINQKGGVLNSPLQIIINDGESAFNDTSLSKGDRQDVILDIANSFAANPNLVAVIGHSYSNIAELASVVYQNNGVLFLAPIARYSKLTGHNFDYIFRTIPSNIETGSQLADYAAQLGYKNIAIIHGRDDSATELADAFEAFTVDRYATNIVYHHSFFDENIDVVSLVINLKNIQKLDAIFIAASSKISAEIYQQSRDMGVKQPFIGGEFLDTKVFLDQIKQWENTKNIQKSSIPTLFNASAPDSEKFVKAFKLEYGADTQPNFLAALGYDAVNLLAHAIQLAQSRVPIEIAVTLRYMEACKGVAGSYQFTPNGDLKHKPLNFKHFDKGGYVYEQIKNAGESNVANIEICNDIDRDHDTVPNNMDACPNSTPEEIAKGIMLEGSKKGCARDDDGDGIADYDDSCLNTTAEELAKEIDSRGCPVGTNKYVGDSKDKPFDGI